MIHIVILIGGVFFCILPFIRVRDRVRDRWASIAVFLIGLLEVAKESIYIMLDRRWLTLHSHNDYWILHNILMGLGGTVFGLIISLVLAGQVTGKKQPPNTALEPTATAP
ncbi:MAG: hypothetical protein ACREFE_18860 [Limisphaerales bacterium]